VNSDIDGQSGIAAAAGTEHGRDSAISNAAAEHARDHAASAADEHAREYATDPRRSILLQAPAGSGKTTVLTQRLLRLLAEVDEPEEILAITFTRKAAAEMRARVLKALRGEIDTNTAQGRRLQALASAALERGARRGWNLAQDPGRLRIQTIDSFNFRLASQLPVTAKAGGSLTITDRPRELYSRAARATLAAAAATLFLAGATVSLVSTSAQAASGQCFGANACKGQSACKSASNSCKGLNACKGLGFSKTSEKQCGNVGGKFVKS